EVRIEDASEKAMCAIDGAGFDWSDMAEEEIQANMALLAFSDSEVTNDKSCSKSCLKNCEALKKQYDDLLVKLDDTGFKASTYKRGHKEYLMGLLRTELEKVKEEKEGFEFKIAKFEKSSKDLDQLLASQITDKSKKGFGYNVVPSPHPLILNRPTPSNTLVLSYSGLQEFKHLEVNEYGPGILREERTLRKLERILMMLQSLMIGDLSVDEDDVELSLRQGINAVKASDVGLGKTINQWCIMFSTNIITLMHEADPRFVDSGCSRHMSGNIAHLSDFKDFDGGYVTFELKFNLFSVSQMCDKKNYVLFTDSECLVLSPNFKLPDENQILLKIPRQDNMYSFDMKNIVPKDGLTCLVAKATSEESMLCIKREYSVARTPQQNGVAERKNRTLIEAARTMLADSKLPTTFWAEAVSTACYVQNRVLIVKPHNKTPYELFRDMLWQSLWEKVMKVSLLDILKIRTKKENFLKLLENPPWVEPMQEELLSSKLQKSKKGIFISQDKYVHEILRKFNYSDVKSASTPTDLEKPLVKDGDAADVFLQRSLPSLSVREIFRYLKGKPSLGLWYSKDSPLELVAYTDSDYAGATQDRKSTTWRNKTVVATSTTEAEICGWLQVAFGQDLLTKVLDAGRFRTWSQVIGMLNP
ncbi:ribonuclease H-like domain-containing protein, partial [Tanacetum coccineum]